MKYDFRKIFSRTPIQDHGVFHIGICAVVMLVILSFVFGLAYAVPLVSSSRPNYPGSPPTLRVRLAYGAVLTFFGMAVYFLLYAYLGYNFYLGYERVLAIKATLILWPLLWWYPVFAICRNARFKEVRRENKYKGNSGKATRCGGELGSPGGAELATVLSGTGPRGSVVRDPSGFRR